MPLFQTLFINKKFTKIWNCNNNWLLIESKALIEEYLWIELKYELSWFEINEKVYEEWIERLIIYLVEFQVQVFCINVVLIDLVISYNIILLNSHNK